MGVSPSSFDRQISCLNLTQFNLMLKLKFLDRGHVEFFTTSNFVINILLIAYCLLLSVSSKGKQTLTFGTSNFSPGVIVDPESGRCSGYLIDNVNKIFAESDFRLKIVCAPTSRMYRMLVSGQIDLTVTLSPQ